MDTTKKNEKIGRPISRTKLSIAVRAGIEYMRFVTQVENNRKRNELIKKQKEQKNESST